MTEPTAPVRQELPRNTPQGQARAAALQAVASLPRQATSLVAYASAGHLLIIGDDDDAMSLAQQLAGRLTCTVLVKGEQRPLQNPAGPSEGISVFRADPESLDGHLGAFVLKVATPQGPGDLAEVAVGEGRYFDLVLDVGRDPLLSREILPPGYYAPRGDDAMLQSALGEIPEMVGGFEKPKFFDYNPDICAHGASGIGGCTRCIEACPTEAIGSIGDRIQVDPHLCQGGGSCATACPTGAITYKYPAVVDVLGSVRELLKTFRGQGGKGPCLLFHDAETGRERAQAILARSPEFVLPVEVEEIGSVGMEVWLSALAYGAQQVILLATSNTAPSVLRELSEQLGFARSILDGMGHMGERLTLFGGEHSDGSVAAALSALAPSPALTPAGFDVFDEKRTTLRLAIEHLYEQAPSPRAVASLPVGAPFGQVTVDGDACTVCMACASVCPASALKAGDELPQLMFVERNCVQCGICEKACPEDAITLQPRMLYGSEENGRARILNEDQPFHCISCGRPFATRSVMASMALKLKDHWMFQDEAAMRRLKMCEQCRVKDMFRDGQGPIDVHGVPRPM